MKTNLFIKKHWVLAAVIVLGAILRLWQLGGYPALNADEAAIGYNVFSLIRTRLDEHGNAWPIHFESFGDYKPGLYFYLVLPFVYLFGLSEWAVRFPGALLGILTIPTVYCLVGSLRPGTKFKSKVPQLAAALLLAISPWHIHFSRGGWEVNAATFFVTMGVLYFIKSTREKNNFALSFLFFVLSLYTYHAARVVVPLIILGLTFWYRKQVFYKKDPLKIFLGSILFAVVICAPLISSMASSAGLARASGLSIFSDPGHVARIEERRNLHPVSSPVPARLIYNRPVEYTKAFVNNYLAHFSPSFLFTEGDPIQRNKVPNMGQLYTFQAPLLVLGLLFILKKPSVFLPIILWLLLAPIPAALTFQSPHALRAQNMAIPLSIISAYGFWYLVTFVNKYVYGRFSKMTIYAVFVALVVFSMAKYLENYYVQMAKELPFSSQYGLPELFSYVNARRGEFDKIVVTERYDQPYILFLFYGAKLGDKYYAPERFQAEHELTLRDKFGFSTVREYGNFLFMNIDEYDFWQHPNSLVVLAADEHPGDRVPVEEIFGSNGILYFRVFKNHED